MPREARRLSNNKVYHCMIRGVNQQDIFFEEQDYLKFQEIIKRTKQKFLYQLYSYVLMPNHIHLEIKDENQKLSQIIHNIATIYAKYFNDKYQRKGHLFESRFLSKNVESQYYILNLIRYIHQNPVKAGISSIDKYKWSSYSEYFINECIDCKDKIVDKEEILKMVEEQEKTEVKDFFKFNNRTIKFEDSIELLEFEMRSKLKDEEVIYFINKKLGISNIQEIQNYNVVKRNKIIQEIKKIKGVTQPQIARILGLSVGIVERVKKE